MGTLSILCVFVYCFFSFGLLTQTNGDDITSKARHTRMEAHTIMPATT